MRSKNILKYLFIMLACCTVIILVLRKREKDMSGDKLVEESIDTSEEETALGTIDFEAWGIQDVTSSLKPNIKKSRLSSVSNKSETILLKEGPEAEQQRRLQTIDRVCKGVLRGNTENILMYAPKKMSYCVIPKNGCTYWIRMMRYLNKDTGGKNVSSPFDILRSEAHGWRYNQTLYRLQNLEHQKIISNTTRFMVSRNPYSKLLSGYIDKLYLPFYWTFQGTNMIKMVRKDPSPLSLKCGHDLSFQEYLDYLLTKKDLPTHIDGHFRPTQFYCSPCIFKPHIVAKQESFQTDSEYILGKFGLLDLVKSYDHKSHVTDELTILLHDNVKWADSKLITQCSGRKEFLLRVWRSFQINGYLPLDSESIFTSMSSSDINTSFFQQAVFKAFRDGQADKTSMKKQRRSMMVEMYRNVSRSTVEQIAEMYKFDFELFDYDSHPSDIFN